MCGMFKKQEPPCFSGVQEAVDCLCREAVILQNIAQYGDFEARGRHLRSIAAAAHRGWREQNAQLSRAFITAVDREDISYLTREVAAVCNLLADTAVLWQAEPHPFAAAWADRLAEGCGLLQDLAAALPRLREGDALSLPAEALFSWRRAADSAFADELPRLPAAARPLCRAFHRCCTALAALADTAEWIALKNG